MSLPSPVTMHLNQNAEYRDHVYMASEDTFLFLDALEKDKDLLRSRMPALVVDVGCGNGSLGVFLLQLFQNPKEEVTEEKVNGVLSNKSNISPAYLPLVLGVDINPVAAIASKLTSRWNHVAHSYEAVSGSFLNFFRSNQMDIILFNPPYVESESHQVARTVGTLDAAWAGGQDGAEVIHSFIDHLSTCLSKNGLCYLLVEKRNDVAAVQNHLRLVGFNSTVVISKRRRNEVLTVLRCSFRDRENQ